jgi:hypothetical protein
VNSSTSRRRALGQPQLVKTSLEQCVAFRIIWRNVSELFGVMSWHARAERSVSEAARELAMSRFRLIQPHLEKNRCQTRLL